MKDALLVLCKIDFLIDMENNRKFASTTTKKDSRFIYNVFMKIRPISF